MQPNTPMTLDINKTLHYFRTLINFLFHTWSKTHQPTCTKDPRVFCLGKPGKWQRGRGRLCYCCGGRKLLGSQTTPTLLPGRWKRNVRPNGRTGTLAALKGHSYLIGPTFYWYPFKTKNNPCEPGSLSTWGRTTHLHIKTWHLKLVIYHSYLGDNAWTEGEWYYTG